MHSHECEQDKCDTSTMTDDQPFRMSRGQLLRMAGAGLALASFPAVTHAEVPSWRLEFPFYPHTQGTYTPEDLRDILNMLVTIERFNVAVITANLNGTIQPGLHPLHVPIEQAAVVAELAHVDLLESLGGESLTDTFTFFPGGVGESTAGLQGKELFTTLQVGAYITATREFAELGQPLLAKYAFQLGAEHAEHRALARAVQTLENAPNEMPPANKAFETDLFLYVRDAYKLMSDLGVFGNLPVRLRYPSRDAVLTAAGPMAQAEIQRVPNNATVSVTIADLPQITSERP